MGYEVELAAPHDLHLLSSPVRFQIYCRLDGAVVGTGVGIIGEGEVGGRKLIDLVTS